MTTPLVASLHASSERVAVAWIMSIPGLVADGVATQLPSDETSWAKNGFVVVPTSVGGTPESNMPVRRPVVTVETWGTVPGSDKIPWGIPDQLMAQIIAGTYDRTTFGRPLTLVAGKVTYPTARVLSATAMSEPRRIWSDVGDYGGYTADIRLDWIAAGEVIP